MLALFGAIEDLILIWSFVQLNGGNIAGVRNCSWLPLGKGWKVLVLGAYTLFEHIVKRHMAECCRNWIYECIQGWLVKF